MLRKKKKLLAEEKAKEKVEIERKRKLIEKQGLAELGHQKIVKRLNRQIKKTYMAKAKQMEIEEARKENEEHVVDKVEAEMNAFKENRRHSDIARETKERIRRQKMKAKKVVEDEKFELNVPSETLEDAAPSFDLIYEDAKLEFSACAWAT